MCTLISVVKCIHEYANRARPDEIPLRHFTIAAGSLNSQVTGGVIIPLKVQWTILTIVSNLTENSIGLKVQNYSLFPMSTPDRRQSKTLLTIDECGLKIARNSVFDCHLSPIWRQMAIENYVSNDVRFMSVDSINIFDCCLSGVMIWLKKGDNVSLYQ